MAGDVLAFTLTAATLIFAGRRLNSYLLAHWHPEGRGVVELPASRSAVRVIPPVVDWESREWCP